ncbi:MAG TPA: inorganic phosphate transporter [Clostridiales bacterium]|nr:inorganic phosphate transporter [Clostridiales bacterium]
MEPQISVGLVVVLLLVLASVFVNGWTDAPNAIATVVSTRVLKPRAAVFMAAVFNLLGILVMGTAVADTIGKIIKLSPGTDALSTIAAAQFAIVVWGTAAWRFGIPTSESHALIAALTGAGIAGMGGISAISGSAWAKVGQGLLSSTFLGFFSGLLVIWLITKIFSRIARKTANTFFSYAQMFSAASMAFSHGAQDGQKFMGVMALALSMAGFIQRGADGSLQIPLWIMLLCSVVMAVGTSIGGYRIIKTMGIDMVKLEKYQGFSAEIAASANMILLTRLGIPVSTTHMISTAIMGVGAARGVKRVNWKVVKELVLTWVLTFPICGMIGFVMSKLFQLVF